MKRALLLLALMALPLGAALPSACGDPCVVRTSAEIYTPPVVVVASGATVHFEGDGFGHVTRDGTNLGDGDPCFVVVTQARERAGVRFDIEGGVLLATVDDETLPCEGATLTPAGAALSFYCVLHPTMRGTFVVTPP